jgi:flavin reductase (DIM6/NTAB) family NADH-FMN oxidoreductase RutF
VPFERTPSGGIVLTEAPAWADVTLRETVTIGDHAVAVVEVTDVGLRTDSPEALTLKELGLNYGG